MAMCEGQPFPSGMTHPLETGDTNSALDVAWHMIVPQQCRSRYFRWPAGNREQPLSEQCRSERNHDALQFMVEGTNLAVEVLAADYKTVLMERCPS